MNTAGQDLATALENLIRTVVREELRPALAGSRGGNHLITEKEAAARIHKSLREIRRRRALGEIRSVPMGRSHLYREEEVERFIRAQEALGRQKEAFRGSLRKMKRAGGASPALNRG